MTDETMGMAGARGLGNFSDAILLLLKIEALIQKAATDGVKQPFHFTAHIQGHEVHIDGEVSTKPPAPHAP